MLGPVSRPSHAVGAGRPTEPREHPVVSTAEGDLRSIAAAGSGDPRRTGGDPRRTEAAPNMHSFGVRCNAP